MNFRAGTQDKLYHCCLPHCSFSYKPNSMITIISVWGIMSIMCHKVEVLPPCNQSIYSILGSFYLFITTFNSFSFKSPELLWECLSKYNQCSTTLCYMDMASTSLKFEPQINPKLTRQLARQQQKVPHITKKKYIYSTCKLCEGCDHVQIQMKNLSHVADTQFLPLPP